MSLLLLFGDAGIEVASEKGFVVLSESAAGAALSESAAGAALSESAAGAALSES